jgi:sterol desaturase/sphingolipid hydroxylase (fatty acid hydroxylase superfamily)
MLGAGAAFNHGNLRIALSVDRVLRWFVMTPDMHRVHHSIEDDETNSNFGFNVPLWDRLFATYRDQSTRVGRARIGAPVTQVSVRKRSRKGIEHGDFQ